MIRAITQLSFQLQKRRNRNSALMQPTEKMSQLRLLNLDKIVSELLDRDE